MIGTRFAVTAAHCVGAGEDAPTVPFDVSVDGNTYSIVEVRINNCFVHADDGPNSADVAILVLGSDYSGSTVGVWDAATDGTEVGEEMLIMGYGNYGPIGGPYTSTGDVFHSGKNVVDRISGNTIVYSMTENSAISNEAMSWSGDSGGPVFIMSGASYKIAGVNSGGACCAYGNEDAYARLGSTFASTWITANTISSTVGAGTSAIDDCSVWADGALNQFMVGSATVALLSYIFF